MGILEPWIEQMLSKFYSCFQLQKSFLLRYRASPFSSAFFKDGKCCEALLCKKCNIWRKKTEGFDKAIGADLSQPFQLFSHASFHCEMPQADRLNIVKSLRCLEKKVYKIKFKEVVSLWNGCWDTPKRERSRTKMNWVHHTELVLCSLKQPQTSARKKFFLPHLFPPIFFLDWNSRPDEKLFLFWHNVVALLTKFQAHPLSFVFYDFWKAEKEGSLIAQVYWGFFTYLCNRFALLSPHRRKWTAGLIQSLPSHLSKFLSFPFGFVR